MTTFIGIIAAGHYPHSPLPVGLRDMLEEEIRKHMEAYGLSKVTVITEEDDRKRASANELYEALKPLEPLLEFIILTVEMSEQRKQAFKALHKKVQSALSSAGGDHESAREFLELLDE